MKPRQLKEFEEDFQNFDCPPEEVSNKKGTSDQANMSTVFQENSQDFHREDQQRMPDEDSLQMSILEENSYD